MEARDMDTKLLSAPESNNTLARCWFRRNVPVTTSGPWHDKLLTLVVGKVSSIPTFFSWGGSISPDGFLPSILLLVVIIVAVVVVAVIVVVVVVVVIVNRALLPDSLASRLWWWLPPEFEALKRTRAQFMAPDHSIPGPVLHEKWLLIKSIQTSHPIDKRRMLTISPQKASDYDISGPVPPRKNVVSLGDKTDSSQKEIEFLFNQFFKNIFSWNFYSTFL
ncbi:hypothetical protein Tco_0336428 [Tanacetum coccineum]